MEIPILLLFLLQRLKPTNPAAQKALTTPTHYKLTPRPATRVRPKALQSAGSAKSQLFDGLDDDEPSLSNGAFMPKLVLLFCILEGGGAGRTVALLQFWSDEVLNSITSCDLMQIGIAVIGSVYTLEINIFYRRDKNGHLKLLTAKKLWNEVIIGVKLLWSLLEIIQEKLVQCAAPCNWDRRAVRFANAVSLKEDWWWFHNLMLVLYQIHSVTME